MTPNGATVISALLSGGGIAWLALGTPSLLMGVGVAVLLAGGYVMDSVDGQLARLRGGGSVRGEWLDHTIDCFKTATLHLAVLICWYHHPPIDNDAALLVPLLYEVVQVVTYFGFIVMPYLRANDPGRATPAAAPTENPLRTWLILPTDYGFLCWTFILLAWPAVFFWAYAALAALGAALLALGLRKWWGELGRIDEAIRAARGAAG
jgi:phosphatidylglycerophosphate synthase